MKGEFAATETEALRDTNRFVQATHHTFFRSSALLTGSAGVVGGSSSQGRAGGAPEVAPKPVVVERAPAKPRPKPAKKVAIPPVPRFHLRWFLARGSDLMCVIREGE